LTASGVAPSPVSATSDQSAACANGLDDDCDGYIDCGGVTLPDLGCTMTPAVTVCPRDGGASPDAACTVAGPEGSPAACSNGVDDDCDGFIDCSDFDCPANPAVTFCPRDAGRD